MDLTIFLHQVRCFGGRGVDIYPWDLSIEPHKWHSYGQQWYVDRIYPK